MPQPTRKSGLRKKMEMMNYLKKRARGSLLWRRSLSLNADVDWAVKDDSLELGVLLLAVRQLTCEIRSSIEQQEHTVSELERALSSWTI